MGFAKVNVWIHDIENPCRISDQNWFVNVTDCSNHVVEYCGKRYAGIPARCGHTEFRLPPGCYHVWAAVSVAVRPPFLYANHITHFGVIVVDCEETACVHLYAPTYHWCWRAVLFSTRLLAAQEAIPQEAANKLVEALEEVNRHVQRTPADKALDPLFKELPEMMKQQFKEEGGGG